MAYKRFNTSEIRKQFTNLRDYEIYMIKQFGSCGVANWYKNLDNLDNDTLRIIFVLLMENNRQELRISHLNNRITDLETDLMVLRGDDDEDFE